MAALLFTMADVLSHIGISPLHIAAQTGQSATVQYLLSVGANKESSTRDNWTPLWIAARMGHLEVVKLLVESGANNGPRPWVGNGLVLVGPFLYELLHHLQVTLLRSNEERCSTIDLGLVLVSSLLYQVLPYRQMSILGCDKERSGTIAVGGHVLVGSLLHQMLHNRQMALLCSNEKSSCTIARRLIHETFIE